MNGEMIWAVILAIIVIVVVWGFVHAVKSMEAEKNARLAPLRTEGWSLDHQLDRFPGLVFDVKQSRFAVVHDKSNRAYTFDDVSSIDLEGN